MFLVVGGLEPTFAVWLWCVCAARTGTTSQSCNVRLLLSSVCWQIASVYRQDTVNLPTDYPSLVARFHSLITVSLDQQQIHSLTVGLFAGFGGFDGPPLKGPSLKVADSLGYIRKWWNIECFFAHAVFDLNYCIQPRQRLFTKFWPAPLYWCLSTYRARL